MSCRYHQVSQGQLQDFTGYSANQIPRLLAQVIEAGFAHVLDAPNGKTPTRYALTLDAPYDGVVPAGDGKGGGR